MPDTDFPAANWSDLQQRDKYEIIRDYVRRGFNDLDDIITDYEQNTSGIRTSLSLTDRASSAIDEVIDEWYALSEYPNAGFSDVDW